MEQDFFCGELETFSVKKNKPYPEPNQAVSHFYRRMFTIHTALHQLTSCPGLILILALDWLAAKSESSFDWLADTRKTSGLLTY
jgi:hypothetical protein